MVASVGGAIIAATFIAAFVGVILAIKESKKAHDAGGSGKYTEMERT